MVLLRSGVHLASHANCQLAGVDANVAHVARECVDAGHADLLK